MNTLDLYVKLYGRLTEKQHIPLKVIALSRRIVKFIAQKHVPAFLKKPYHNPNIKTDVIVSFTSIPERIENVWQVVECMKRQTYKPAKIILWLSEDQFSEKDVPRSLKDRVDDIFDIRMVPGDIRSHKKYYYVLKDYPQRNIFLIDDDIYYPTDLLEKTMLAHKKYPNAIISNYGYKIAFNDDGNPRRYTDWSRIYGDYCGKDFFFGSGGGTLIHRSLLYKDVENLDLAMKYAPLADDIWLNAMVRLQGTQIVKIRSGNILSFNNKNKNRLAITNRKLGENDKQLKNVDEYYQDFLHSGIGNKGNGSNHMISIWSK